MEPFHEKGAASAARRITSVDYKKAAFTLALLGSDTVVGAWNNFMQYNYAHAPDTHPADNAEMLRLYGRLLLEIRRSMGNKKTNLSEIDMLRWLLRDIEAIFPR